MRLPLPKIPNPKQVINWMYHSHRSGLATASFAASGPGWLLTPPLYVCSTLFIGACLSPFLVIEPEAFNHRSHF